MISKLQRHVDFKNPLLIFFISPFFAMLLSIRFARQKWAKNIFWLFCIFFGYSMVVTTTGSENDADSARYKEWFLNLSKKDVSSSNFIDLFYSTEDSGETSYLDIVQPLVTFFLSRVTGNYHFLFAAFAFIFGFFYSRNLWYLFQWVRRRRSFTILMFVAAFALINPIWNINAFRFHTATQIYIYGVLPYLIEGNKKRLKFCLLSVLTHFSFVFPLVILTIYLILGNKKLIYFIFFITSSFIQETNLINLSERIQVPEIFQAKVKLYNNENVKLDNDLRSQQANWYIRYYPVVLKTICYTVLIILFFQSKVFIQKRKSLLNLLCFSLFYYGCANILNVLPQGIRFYTIGHMLIFFLIIFYTYHAQGHGEKIMVRLGTFVLPLLFLIIVVSIRRGFDYLGVYTVIGNPVIISFIDKDFPLIELIK